MQRNYNVIADRIQYIIVIMIQYIIECSVIAYRIQYIIVILITIIQYIIEYSVMVK